MKPRYKHHHHPPPKKRINYLFILLIVIIMLLTVLIGVLLFRPPFQPPNALFPKPIPPVEQLIHASGTVSSFSADNHADVNGFNILLSSKKTVLVNFKPHMAFTIMSAANRGSMVKVDYIMGGRREKTRYELVTVTNLKNNVTVNADEPPPPPYRPGNEITTTYTVKQPALIYDPHGNLTGLKYNHQFFQLPPVQQLLVNDLIKSAANIKILATPRDAKAGFVNINGDKVFQVISITIGAQTYLLR